MEHESNKWSLAYGKSNLKMPKPICEWNFPFTNGFSNFVMDFCPLPPAQNGWDGKGYIYGRVYFVATITFLLERVTTETFHIFSNSVMARRFERVYKQLLKVLVHAHSWPSEGDEPSVASPVRA